MRLSFQLSFWPMCGLVLVRMLVGIASAQEAPSLQPQMAPSKALYDTQALTLPRMSPEETARSAKMPPGFRMQVAAQDPDVQQPIGMCWDSRGRLWVVENYTYSEREQNFDMELSDRILILEDTDRNGTFDKRTVFWDQAKKLTSIEIGYGGVWALAAPQLLFIPDADLDDVPDGPPTIILDGFEDQAIRHNLANGLRWGPDGWLYGRHGIQAVSKVGIPGSSDLERTALSCCLWRWHPSRNKFDIVCEGTTNPWGHDWDQHGQLYFINTVIGHLWHAIPGSHLQRMSGEDADSRIYELMPQIADHLHFDSGNETWSDIRSLGVTPSTDQAGGGHAHCGMMIYQADQWPETYRHKLFTLNYHGRRINVERLEREGAGYVGRHEPDMVFFADQWFRGIELAQGPDGSVFVLDWSDIGECHDNDGIHRHSGVIYQIAYGDVFTSPSVADLRDQNSEELVGLVSSSNAWIARQARLILSERSNQGQLSNEVTRSLIQLAYSAPDYRHRLAGLWTLAQCGKDNLVVLKRMLNDENEYVRIQALQLLVDPSRVRTDVTESIESMITKETSSLVFLHTASALQDIEGERWWPVMARLCARDDLANDRDYPLMLWYALSKKVTDTEDSIGVLVELDRESKDELPYAKLVRLSARLMASRTKSEPKTIDDLMRSALSRSPAFQAQVVLGMLDGLLGRSRLHPPEHWKEFQSSLSAHPNQEIRETVLRLSALFGDGIAIDQLAAIVGDKKAHVEARISALQSMTENRIPAAKDLAYPLVRDRGLGRQAITSILAVGDHQDASKLVRMYASGAPQAAFREPLIAGLIGRREFVPVLIEEVENGHLEANAVDASSLRQIQMLGDPAINAKLNQLWPQTKLLGKERLTQILELEARLTAESLGQAHPAKGRTTWNKLCASCHKLYGQGGLIGPELTGAQRSNLRYWMENVLDPSGIVASNYRVSLFLLDDGTVVSGVVVGEDDGKVTVQTVKEKMTIDKDTVVERKASTQSLMPEGLLDALDDDQRRDLVAYLMSSRQVEPE